jgi:hypothetical protein
VLVVTSMSGGNAWPNCTHRHVVKAGKATGKPRGRWRGCGAQLPRTTPRGSPLGPKALAVFRSGHGVSMTAWGTLFGVRARSGLQGIQGVATDDAATPAPVGHASGRAGDARWPGRTKTGPTAGAGTLGRREQAPRPRRVARLAPWDGTFSGTEPWQGSASVCPPEPLVMRHAQPAGRERHPG